MKETNRKARKIMAVYTVVVLCLTVFATTAFAANDPITVVNNLSTFMFGLIRAVGMILLPSSAIRLPPRTVSFRGSLHKTRRLTGLRALYYHYCSELRILVRRMFKPTKIVKLNTVDHIGTS